MSKRNGTVLGPQDQLHLDDPDTLRCTIAGCRYEGINLVRKTGNFRRDGQLVDRDFARCRRHTSRYDRLIIGPGPLEDR